MRVRRGVSGMAFDLIEHADGTWQIRIEYFGRARLMFGQYQDLARWPTKDLAMLEHDRFVLKIEEIFGAKAKIMRTANG